MSESMSRLLTVHIGPPKTATTSIQLVLGSEVVQTQLARADVALGAPGHPTFDHVVANALLADDISKSAQWFLPGERNLDLEDYRSGPCNRIVSAEGLWRITKAGAERLLQMVAPDRLVVVVGMRSPDGWLWSLWNQLAKTGDAHSWNSFLSSSGETAALFPSRFLAPWMDLGIPTSFKFLYMDSLRGSHAADAFAELLGLNLDLAASKTQTSAGLNASPKPHETLMNSWFSAAVLDYLQNEAWSYFGDIPQDFAKRFLLDIVDTAAPMHEHVLSHGDDELFHESPFAPDSAPTRRYIRSWAKDLSETAATLDTVSALDRKQLLSLARRARASVKAGSPIGPNGLGVPREGFLNLVRVDANLLSVVRTAAMSIGLAWRSAGTVP
jgi:hypothetical protein